MKDLGKNSVFPNRETNIFLWRPKKKKKKKREGLGLLGLLVLKFTEVIPV